MGVATRRRQVVAERPLKLGRPNPVSDLCRRSRSSSRRSKDDRSHWDAARVEAQSERAAVLAGEWRDEADLG